MINYTVHRPYTRYGQFLFFLKIKMGTQGTGAFFYEYWQRSIPSDDVFDIDYNVTEKDEKNANFIFEKFKDNADDIMKQTGTNGFQAEILYKNKILLKTCRQIRRPEKRS